MSFWTHCMIYKEAMTFKQMSVGTNMVETTIEEQV